MSIARTSIAMSDLAHQPKASLVEETPATVLTMSDVLDGKHAKKDGESETPTRSGEDRNSRPRRGSENKQPETPADGSDSDA